MAVIKAALPKGSREPGNSVPNRNTPRSEELKARRSEARGTQGRNERKLSEKACYSRGLLGSWSKGNRVSEVGGGASVMSGDAFAERQARPGTQLPVGWGGHGISSGEPIMSWDFRILQTGGRNLRILYSSTVPGMYLPWNGNKRRDAHPRAGAWCLVPA